MIDICIPVFNNLRCLRIMARGLRRFGVPCRVLLHVQLEAERKESEEAFSLLGIPVSTVSVGNQFGQNMAERMDRLFECCESEWVVFMEQDTFLFVSLEAVISYLALWEFWIAGPLDTFLYDHPNAKGMPKYGTYARLSPMPGYLHSSLLFIQRDRVPKKPFGVPTGFRFQGYGVLGAEPYYGLRLNVPDARRISFLRQQHSSYGWAADILATDWKVATHLYYSGTKTGYFKEGFLTPAEYEWLCSEEDRFLKDYVAMWNL